MKWAAFINLLSRLLSKWEVYQRDKKQKEKQDASDKAHDDPAAAIAEHFGGELREFKQPAPKDETRKAGD